MLAELKRAMSKKEPIVVTLWSPHWAYNDLDLKKLEDPKGAWGEGDGVHTLSRKGFAADNPTVGDWLKNFSMTEEQLTSLEAEINKAGKGQAAGRRPHVAEDPPGPRRQARPGEVRVRFHARGGEAGPGHRLVPLGTRTSPSPTCGRTSWSGAVTS